MLRNLTTLLDVAEGPALPLPVELAEFYGALRFPEVAGRPYVVGNFVTTLDGVVSWNVPGHLGGGEISGFSDEDTAVMGLLRAASEAVVIGAATLDVVPDHLWTPEDFHPELADAYQALRRGLGLLQPPLAVIVSGSGRVDLGLRVFVSGEEPAMVVTTPDGERRLRARGVPKGVTVMGVWPGADGKLNAGGILGAASARLGTPQPRVLVEGGPQLMGTFYKGGAFDEQFLTLSPQVAGRDAALGNDGWRPALVEGALLAPDAPAWGTLVSVRQVASHLFLRYQFRNGSTDARA